MPQRRPEFIDWARSEAKMILLRDLELGTLSLDASHVSAEEAWLSYRDAVARK